MANLMHGPAQSVLDWITLNGPLVTDAAWCAAARRADHADYFPPELVFQAAAEYRGIEGEV